MGKLAINIENLVITYKELHRISLKTLKKSSTQKKKKGYTALNGITFSVEQGKIVGVIGKNGSGKSTLLRAIAGIFAPDEGTIETYGNSVSLLAIGIGFINNLSGRENRILSGLLMGFSKKEIEKKAEEIIEFSELGDFIDKPVQTYSSGMYSKLAFSITAIMESDIILIDEVLSVGDAGFKKKSYNKVKELISHDKRTVLIVSHNMNTIRKLCDKVLWLHNGEIMMYDSTEKVITQYEQFFS